jgi:hypothetical protein
VQIPTSGHTLAAPCTLHDSIERMNTRYNAADIEVLSGLDPVKRRPGMYTDTARPNHLAQEVIDNAVDEALAGHARTISVTCMKTAAARCPTTAAACRWTSIRKKRSPASS